VLPVWDEHSEMGRFRLERQTKLQAALAELGYVIFRIHFDATVKRMEEFGIHADMTQSNYVFVPRAELAAFRRLFEERGAATPLADPLQLAVASR
jgi:hypothetical protein